MEVYIGLAIAAGALVFLGYRIWSSRRAKTGGTPAEKPVIDTSSGLTDYNVYLMNKKEKIKYMAIAAVVFFVVGYIFFRFWPLALLLAALGGYFYPKIKTKELLAKRKMELNLQFKDALYSLSSSLGAGRSVEGAFKAALSDLKILYPDPQTDIIKEFGYIVRRVAMNEPVESALREFSARAGLEDIKNFADVFAICKRTGGNLVEVIKNTAQVINDKIEVQQEIHVLLSGKKFEQKALVVMPFLFIGMLSWGGDAAYIAPLYAQPVGYVVMGVALLMILCSALISRKIVDIKV